jgi:hypothetical protein
MRSEQPRPTLVSLDEAAAAQTTASARYHAALEQNWRGELTTSEWANEKHLMRQALGAFDAALQQSRLEFMRAQEVTALEPHIPGATDE